ncbi:MAG: GMC family oxidoreductase N-terminal domain-containing protein [Chroococcidiopsidaceae cyanobacterium CP_BM_ER_R8_30]|nr:GMC family oxidoreductase N-terminal domain-containing protein [Chroococcidiopsidaceae cyanobacterium CP_BM_ER_R8_30]
MSDSDKDAFDSSPLYTRQVQENQQRLAFDLQTGYDYVICGAGTAGSVLAARLAANPEVKVLLLEAGGTDDSELVMDPNRWVLTLGGNLDWGFQAEANPHLNGRAIPYSMGKVLGGGSSINVSTWSRGHQDDWNFYAAEAGDSAWGYDAVLDLYRHRIEDWAGTPSDYRGTGGSVYVQPAADPHPFSIALLEGAESIGLPRFEDQNGRLMEAEQGCAFVDETVRNGRRQSIFRSYVYPLMSQPNLTVLTQAMVTRIRFQGSRATGVEFRWQGKLLCVNASIEVVLALGAIQTPKLLMQSGIGDPDQLRSFGIEIQQALPGVGRNLHDHVAFGCIWEASTEPLPTAPRSQTVCFWKTNATLTSPNFYTYAAGIPFTTPENAAWIAPPEKVWSLIVGMSPVSRGAIRLTGSNADDPVRIDANYLADPRDLTELKTGIEQARALGNSAPLRRYTTREVHPGTLSSSNREQFLRNGLVTFWHQSCTAKMGRDELSVVDHRLKVYGIDGLRVADASVLPRVTRGNTMAPCVVIGERAAAILQEEHGHMTASTV